MTDLNGVRAMYDVRVPMRDGVALSADIFRPDDDEQHPVILTRTPYVKAGPVTVETAAYFAKAGYAMVFMDVRGRGDSYGEFVPYRNDGRDGYDAIEWLAAQSWSTGAVGTIGGSYAARIQWLTALQQP